MEIFRTPRVTLVSRPEFLEPAHLPVKWQGEASDGERLAEAAGRLCYMSQANPANKTTAEYIDNIKKQMHGSVLEHANYSLLFEGVSRSLTHELVRHRVGMSYSMLSQRYVDESDVGFVMPVALLGNEALEAEFEASCGYALDKYTELVDALLEQYADIENKTERRKKAREAAREVLPNGTETKIVVTGNARAWRHFFTMRGSLGADAQIRRAAIQAFNLLVQEAPAFFGDFTIHGDGVQAHLVPGYTKV